MELHFKRDPTTGATLQEGICKFFQNLPTNPANKPIHKLVTDWLGLLEWLENFGIAYK